MYFMIVFHLSEYKNQVIVYETVLIPWFQVLDSVLFFFSINAIYHLSLQNWYMFIIKQFEKTGN